MTTVYPDVMFASGPTFLNGSSVNQLMPFSYSNNRLDLPSASAAAYPSGSGDTLGNAGATIRMLGGVNQVLMIGTNLQSVLRGKTWDGYTINPTATLTVVSPGIVTRVQQLGATYLAPTWDVKSYNVAPTTWNNSNFVQYNATYLFQKPLVIQVSSATNGGYTGPICITLQTSWDH